MPSHPDADAFVRAFLQNPKDETARLVFADWLEERGEPHHAAWAGYIRAKATAAREEFGSPGWWDADREAGRFANHVRADLRLPVGFFLRYPASLLRLIPGPNLNLRLAGHQIPRSVIELVPESVARENYVLPLATQDRVLLAATDDPINWDTVQKLEFILNRSVVLVGSPTDEIEAAIDEHYGQTETESVDSISYRFPLIGDDGGRDGRVAGSVFMHAFTRGTTGFEVELGTAGGRVHYLPGSGRGVDEDMSEAAYRRLLTHLESLPVVERSVADEIVRRRVDLPMTDGEGLRLDFDVRQDERQARWFRVVFWEPEPVPRRRRR